MDRLLHAKRLICDAFPQIAFFTTGVGLKTADGRLQAIIEVNKDEEVLCTIGLHTFNRQEIEAIAAYMQAVDPDAPQGLYEETPSDPHNQW